MMLQSLTIMCRRICSNARFAMFCAPRPHNAARHKIQILCPGHKMGGAGRNTAPIIESVDVRAQPCLHLLVARGLSRFRLWLVLVLNSGFFELAGPCAGPRNVVRREQRRAHPRLIQETFTIPLDTGHLFKPKRTPFRRSFRRARHSSKTEKYGQSTIYRQHCVVIECADPLADLVTRHSISLVYHHLRWISQTVLRRRFYGNSEQGRPPQFTC